MTRARVFLILGIVLAIISVFSIIYLINHAAGHEMDKAESRIAIGSIIKPFIFTIVVGTLGFTLIAKSIK